LRSSGHTITQRRGENRNQRRYAPKIQYKFAFLAWTPWVFWFSARSAAILAFLCVFASLRQKLLQTLSSSY
jgi:hypothetical protein